MSPFKQDIIKILLDKLLLGVIAAGFGFYLSRLLEDYRTRNAYQLLLAKERVDSYRKIIELVTEHHRGAIAVLDALKDVKKRFPKKLSAEEAEPALTYVERHENLRRHLFSTTVFMSDDVKKSFVAYLARAGDLANFVKTGDLAAELPDEAAIDDALVDLVHVCGQEMWGKS